MLEKLFERLVNNIIKVETTITESQAGSQQGMATADHLMVTAILAQVEYLHVPSVKWEHHCVKYVWTEVVTLDINGI